MTANELARSAAADSTPPAGLSTTALALWFARAGKWGAAHDLCGEIEGSSGSWIHAHLHRVEGDSGNAAYWYQRAGKPVAGVSLEAEWMEIANSLL